MTSVSVLLNLNLLKEVEANPIPTHGSSGVGVGESKGVGRPLGVWIGNGRLVEQQSYGARPTKTANRKRKGVDEYAAEFPIDFTPRNIVMDGEVVRLLVCRFCCQSISARSDRVKEHMSSKRHQSMKVQAFLEADEAGRDLIQEYSGESASVHLPEQPQPITMPKFPENAASSLERQRKQSSHQFTPKPEESEPNQKKMLTPPPPSHRIMLGINKSVQKSTSIPLPPPPRIYSPPKSQQQQYLCVRWGNYDSNMVSMFSKFRSAEHFTDVTLSCEGRSIKCHKIILSACSDHFEQVLVGEKNTNTVIILKDMKLWEIEALVDFMYKGETHVHQDNLQALLRAAESLQIKGLYIPPPPEEPTNLSNNIHQNLSSAGAPAPLPRRAKGLSLPTGHRGMDMSSSVGNSSSLLPNNASASDQANLFQSQSALPPTIQNQPQPSSLMNLKHSRAKRRKIETPTRIEFPAGSKNIVPAYNVQKHPDVAGADGSNEAEPQNLSSDLVPGKKKKFIEKKNAVTFYLAHRSQKDPLIADETAPQRVLVPINQAGSDAPAAGTSRPGKSQNKKDVEKKKEEERKYGIYFDDEYDYLQHLRDSQEVSNVEWDFCERIPAPDINPQMGVSKKSEMKNFKLKLPSSVFESEYVEDIGLLNKAAPNYGPRPDLDPDIVAGLEEDFDYENPANELEDNFMELAGCSGEGEIPKEDLEGLFSDEDDASEDEDESDDDTIGSLDGGHNNQSEDGDGNRSHFTAYSMSSSVLKRNEQLTLLDDRFEKMFEEYEGTEIGPLDCDEIEGHLDPESDVLMQYAEEYEAEKAKEDILNQKILQMAVKDEESETDTNETSSDENEEGKKWDCESILSTYTNTKNRPKLIKEPSKRNVIKISGKTGMPVGVLGSGLTAGNLKELDNQYMTEDSEMGQNVDGKSVGSMASSIWLPRPKVEAPEERLERKLRVKEYKRERRLERKANTEAFKEEKKRQVKVRLNCKANVAGLKL